MRFRAFPLDCVKISIKICLTERNRERPPGVRQPSDFNHLKYRLNFETRLCKIVFATQDLDKPQAVTSDQQEEKWVNSCNLDHCFMKSTRLCTGEYTALTLEETIPIRIDTFHRWIKVTSRKNCREPPSQCEMWPAFMSFCSVFSKWFCFLS